MADIAGVFHEHERETEAPEAKGRRDTLLHVGASGQPPPEKAADNDASSQAGPLQPLGRITFVENVVEEDDIPANLDKFQKVSQDDQCPDNRKIGEHDHQDRVRKREIFHAVLGVGKEEVLVVKSCICMDAVRSGSPAGKDNEVPLEGLAWDPRANGMGCRF